ncbi:MAG TPA: hypothetical protein VG148_04190 [Pyrinomonadaceae bacterium]|nr:hypothetical protein [Pyrinomonadaceae bacterium]
MATAASCRRWRRKTLLISLTIILWWRPASRRHASTGDIREGER